ncbi:hypothetical protein FRC09_015197 [Ceratobasidium sp. 395]|nr:hypothetical protein FRC09_015197 [Ceratobasidium sp. 395]
MDALENLWGPHFDKYSRMQNFEPRPSPAFTEELDSFFDAHNAYPLRYTENKLLLFDLRGDPFGQIRMMPLADSIHGLLNYMSEANHDALQHYYGYLCIRHMLYSTCLAILNGAGIIDEVAESMHPNASWGEWSQAVTLEALNLVVAQVAVYSHEEFGKFVLRSPGFTSDSNGSEIKTAVLISALQKVRDRFLTLCSQGLLPGCSLLLLVLQH